MSESGTEPTVVLFGGTGDLAMRKLLPALFKLWKQKEVGKPLVLALGRRVEHREAYLEQVRGEVGPAKEEPEAWHAFEARLDYAYFDASQQGAFAKLRRDIEEAESRAGVPGRRLFYLSVAPGLFDEIVEGLGHVGLLKKEPDVDADPWCRVVVEKPFGRDLESSIELDRTLHTRLSERQVFRIDHYLGKDTVQNLLAFRFANGMIEPLWNRNTIERVEIDVTETIGVGGRGAFYDEVGALRDMMQNHMMQLVSLVAMEPPASMGADDLRNEKVKVLRAIRTPDGPDEVARTTTRAQYTAGKIGGERAVGYLEEEGVEEGSGTPTFAAAQLEIENWRWSGVPFRLVHGKRLDVKRTEIRITFKTPPMRLFRLVGCPDECPNVLTIRIQPEEEIFIRIGAKQPGGPFAIDPVRLHFSYGEHFGGDLPEAYERLLLDAIRGDAALFPRSDEVRAAWRWADAIREGWEALGPESMQRYEAGTPGAKTPWGTTGRLPG